MKAVILAGGLGTRIGEETVNTPKPMIEIGGRPIIWHIMKCYSHYGISDFIICCGYKAYILKEFFSNFSSHLNDIEIDLSSDKVSHSKQTSENWKINLVDTGPLTMTGGRLKRIQSYLKKDTNFCFTYGDGLSNINIAELIDFHKNHGKLATVTAVYPPARFGALEIQKNGNVSLFKEKPYGEGGYINGGFFVLSSRIFELFLDDDTVWEEGPLKTLASKGELKAFVHNDFWLPMDTMRDRVHLEKLWDKGNAPWKIWA